MCTVYTILSGKTVEIGLYKLNNEWKFIKNEKGGWWIFFLYILKFV